MNQLPLDPALRLRIRKALAACDIFRGLTDDVMTALMERSHAIELTNGEVLVAEGGPSDSLFVVLDGGLDVVKGGEAFAQIGPGVPAGEMGILLDEPRTATLRARGSTVVILFGARDIVRMIEMVPGFAAAISRGLARRLKDANQRVPLPMWEGDATRPSAAALDMLPQAFLRRHKVLPLEMSGKTLIVGCVSDPNQHLMESLQGFLPSLSIKLVRIPSSAFEQVLRRLGDGGDNIPMAVEYRPDAPPPELNLILRRMVAEGASDLHLSAGHSPWWRSGGDLKPVPDTPRLGTESVYKMLEPVMEQRWKDAFLSENDVDFAYAIEAVARFRINLFRDHRGVGAVIRQIPSKVLTFEQLGLPAVIARLCEYSKGLVLVTGPTGSGKSTTLAAMIDAINRSRASHILTMEDPIEFVHPSKRSLVNQREVGSHTRSFSRALKAALREDPDVVLVGELRDHETVQLALETANTGHLVFATLHTNTAASTIDRIVDLFPAEMHGTVRASLADSLRGVICQTLCKKVGGGRIAALEILVSTSAVANLIREGKTVQIGSVMQTGRNVGMQVLNDELAQLALDGVIDTEEAMSRSVDKLELAKRLQRPR